MNLQYPYYVAGEGFSDYDDAVFYSEVLLAQEGVYHVVYCRHEIEAHLQEVLE
jgi:hypothetical protein